MAPPKTEFFEGFLKFGVVEWRWFCTPLPELGLLVGLGGVFGAQTPKVGPLSLPRAPGVLNLWRTRPQKRGV